MTRTAGYAPWFLGAGISLAALAGPASGQAAAATGPADPSAVFGGTVNQPITGSLPGATAATFSITDPTLLPPGMSITATGTVTGIPAADGIYSVPVSACVATLCAAGTVSFTIAPDTAPCDNAPPLSGTLPAVAPPAPPATTPAQPAATTPVIAGAGQATAGGGL
jgi:hypothetical protein